MYNKKFVQETVDPEQKYYISMANCDKLFHKIISAHSLNEIDEQTNRK
jgi:hypothetical protein